MPVARRAQRTAASIMAGMHTRLLLPALFAAAGLSACALSGPPVSRPAEPSGGRPPPGAAQPAPPVPEPLTPETPAPPAQGGAPPARQFHLSAASSALVSQAHQQAASGDFGQAAATLERALRIEPDNPLVWIELGRLRLAENNAGQADAMGRKALALATGDPGAQSSAWHLIADALRARGNNAEAADADRRAASLAPH
jgi:tetratricopeptide (TPR) repeat protein